MRLLRSTCPFFLLFFAFSCAFAESPCMVNGITARSAEENMFSPQQAAQLGDIVFEHLSREYKLVRDPELNTYAQRMADRMTQAAGIEQVNVELVDIPHVNAFAFPGGRILVSRKLVSYARTEDELAAVLAHEIGHVMTRDAERYISALFRKVLKVSKISDRHDLEENYHRLIENRLRREIAIRVDDEHEQLNADNIAIRLMALVGYSPQAYGEVWDRVNELKSETGSWLGELFGTSKPGTKRYRLALRNAAALPGSCTGRQVRTPDEFQTWQKAVVQASRNSGAANQVRGIVSETALNPPLRPDIHHLTFSSDGKWILAQDEAGIYILSREPLRFSFRIDADGALDAQFTPDSRAIVFYDENYRVERWDVESRTRAWVRELPMTQPCLDSTLSSDGASFACVTRDFDLRIVAVTTGDVLFEKKNIYAGGGVADLVSLLVAVRTGSEGRSGFFNVVFSPDGMYLIATRHESVVAVDVARRTAISLPQSIRSRVGFAFAFAGADKILGVHLNDPQKSALVSFPSGQVIKEFGVGRQGVQAPVRGERYAILRPIQDYPVGVYDLEWRKIIMASRSRAFAIFEDQYLSERKSGEIAVFSFSKGLIAATDLPVAPLSTVRAAAISDDLRVLALSTRTRGGIWNLKTGKRLSFVRGFSGAMFAGNNTALLDFSRENQRQRTIARIDYEKNIETPLVVIAPEDETRDQSAKPSESDNNQQTYRVQTTITERSVVQAGAYLLGWRDLRDKKKQVFVVKEVGSAKELWTRVFDEGDSPDFSTNSRHNTLVFDWSMDAQLARNAVQRDPSLRKRFSDLNTKREGVRLLEIVELSSGKMLGQLMVDTGMGSFTIKRSEAAGDIVLISDNHNRTLVYSVSAGEQLGRVFGDFSALSDSGRMVAVENNAGQVAIYALPSLTKQQDVTFGSGVIAMQFCADGKRLFVLTKDQHVLVVDTEAASVEPAKIP